MFLDTTVPFSDLTVLFLLHNNRRYNFACLPNVLSLKHAFQFLAWLIFISELNEFILLLSQSSKRYSGVIFSSVLSLSQTFFLKYGCDWFFLHALWREAQKNVQRLLYVWRTWHIQVMFINTLLYGSYFSSGSGMTRVDCNIVRSYLAGCKTEDVRWLQQHKYETHSRPSC